MSGASLVDDTLADLLCGSVKARRGRGDIRARARRVVNYTPEVMVKMTGNVRSGTRVASHMNYISRNGSLAFETEDGHILTSKEEVKELAKEWKKDADDTRPGARLTTNIVLSMPPGTDIDGLKEAARRFARRTFGDNYRYVFVLHTDEKHPHVHLTINNRGFDGRQLHIPKGKPQQWREAFAEELRDQDIEAEATPRAARGIVRKAVSRAVHHMRRRGVTPETDAGKAKEAGEMYRNKERAPPAPWEAAVVSVREKVRHKWITAAKLLNRTDDPVNRALARDMAAFVGAMPPPKTLTALIAKEIGRRQRQGGKEEGYTGAKTYRTEAERGGDGPEL